MVEIFSKFYLKFLRPHRSKFNYEICNLLNFYVVQSHTTDSSIYLTMASRAVRLLEQLLVIVASQSQLCDKLHAIYLKVN